MRPQRTRKKRKLCIKNPLAVGAPLSEAIIKNPPNTRCVSLKVSGFAITKKTKVL